MNVLKKMSISRAVVLMAIVCVVASPSVQAEDINGVETLRRASRAFSEVAKKAMPAVVAVQVETVEQVRGGLLDSPFDDEFFDRFFGSRPRSRQPQQPQERRRQGQASGFLISEDGYALTNHHVIAQADKVRILLNDGRTFENVEVVGSDERSDIALLKIPDASGLPYVELGNSDDLEVGEWVVAIGNPFGLTETLTVGVVSAKGRRISQNIEDYQAFIQTDAAINPGNSGGPLLNLDAKVIGINSAIITGTGGYMGVGLAVPINMAVMIKNQLKATGQVQRGYLGISMQNLGPEMAQFFEIESGGVIITHVEENSPAEKSGLRKDDIIIGIDNSAISNSNEIRNIIGFTSPGTTLDIKIVREGKERTLKVTIGAQEESQLAQTSELGRKLGLSIQAVDAEAATQLNLTEGKGVLVVEVTPDSPADRAGIEANMVIESINRRQVNSVAEFNNAVKAAEETRQVLLLVRTGRLAQYVLLRLP